MRFRGPLDRLQTNYTSDPALPPADIIHLLAFGNTEEAANAAPSQSTTQSAESLVASQVSGQVTSRLQKVRASRRFRSIHNWARPPGISSQARA